MKITPAMVEAGVAAMARIKRQHPVDSSVVATVFSAMYAALLREEKRLAGTLTPEVYSHQDWPAWRYGPDGIGRTFERPEDVPEGWVEQPPHIRYEVRTDVMHLETVPVKPKPYAGKKRGPKPKVPNGPVAIP